MNNKLLTRLQLHQVIKRQLINVKVVLNRINNHLFIHLNVNIDFVKYVVIKRFPEMLVVLNVIKQIVDRR